MNPRALRSLTIAAFIMTLLWALVIAVCLSRAELPAGMHRASIVRPWDSLFQAAAAETDSRLSGEIDTLCNAYVVWSPHTTRGTRTLDSLDSLWRARGLGRIKR